MSTKPDCPECRSRMEEGFIPDMSQGAAVQMFWHAGTPEDQTFLGLKMGTIKIDKSEAVKITAYRCTRCGFLQSYARKE